MKTKFDTILTSSEEREHSGLAIVQIRTNACLTLSVAAARQLVAGSTHIDELKSVSQSVITPQKMMEISDIAGKLHDSAVFSMFKEENTFRFHVTRENVENMKLMIEARMLHCEGENNVDNPRFDPDSYILQKLVLMEIINWLSVKSYVWKSEGMPSNVYS